MLYLVLQCLANLPTYWS